MLCSICIAFADDITTSPHSLKLCTTVNFTRYYFCTDAGTLYAPHMLCTLLGHMEANQDCGACCGELRKGYANGNRPDCYRSTILSQRWAYIRFTALSPKCVVFTPMSFFSSVAGHQRIMHYRDQMDPEEAMEGARESWDLWALRSIQVSTQAVGSGLTDHAMLPCEFTYACTRVTSRYVQFLFFIGC